MADDFEIRAFQGYGEAWDVYVGGAFTGSEVLKADFYSGDSSTAILSTVPTWIAPVAPATTYTHVSLALTAAQLLALTPGPSSILIGLANGTAAIAKGFLEVYPAPGGAVTPYYRCLASPALAQSYLPQLSREQLDTLPHALVSATRVIETYVGRPLVLDCYDHIIRPNNSRRIRLKTRPVVEVTRVKANVQPAIMLDSSLALGSQANVRTIPVAPWSLQIASLVFSTTVSGITINQTITISSFLGVYITVGSLTGMINALGHGWSATTQSGIDALPVSEIYGTPNTIGVSRERPYLKIHTDWLGYTWSDPDQGFIEINEPIPGGTLVPNPRVEPTDYRDWGVRVSYRAGYAVTAADIALGYYPVPEDLQSACIMTAQAIIETMPTTGPVKSQSVKDRSYTLRDAHSVIPESARIILAKYQEFVI